MKKTILITLIPFLFVACGTKNNAFRYFDKDETEINAIRNTKKIDIIKKNEVDVILMATYLNKIDSDISSKDEKFLIYTFFANLEEQDFRKNSYEILLNGKTPKQLESVDKSSKRYKDIMLKNSWGNYYIVTFDNPQKVTDLKIVLRPKTNEAVLNFEK
ncbi:hypothetical protein [Arcobacter porcinus]|uniref:Lipoprotein n=1 Tax=Arcobacter porcinus TaxID=1935204 RepID=A0A5C2HCG1_9BACT|nr:hypothetical protein [Arcobacter porcinus]OCL86610.1 hypothetical protein AAX30_01335 [Arcobacter porcinus]OCL96806.1 hypothetical protein AAX27_00438 [Aliarcobacter thereius]QEP40636.1 hypothetical protein APORC_1034 [Arcobacter porcinus]